MSHNTKQQQNLVKIHCEASEHETGLGCIAQVRGETVPDAVLTLLLSTSSICCICKFISCCCFLAFFFNFFFLFLDIFVESSGFSFGAVLTVDKNELLSTVTPRVLLRFKTLIYMYTELPFKSSQ